MVEEMTDNNGRCAAVMDPNGCVLSSCKQRCLQQKNGNESKQQIEEENNHNSLQNQQANS
ncbi:hypothetical protein SADUNF_Sadunf16G0265300 [Salix dunnii]|uniref:Uncharacterized protein n=1 Tax=Salix dunnii TaxID=1413687 RepID=A0A835JCC0_9ROSI|nr:hypothetical protein SADUNF_Sadunf16G0265300 [Salix dunnii]